MLKFGRSTRIVVDQDEVLAQFVEEIVRRWNARAGTSFTREDINMWAMEQTFGADSKEWIKETIKSPGLFDDLQPCEGAIKGFNYLRASEYAEVIVATHIQEGMENVYDAKRRWMKKYFPDFDLKNFVAISRKSLIDGDVLIDDGAHNIEEWLDEGRHAAFVFDAPWNRNQCSRAHRVSGWEEYIGFCEKVKELQKYLTAHLPEQPLRYTPAWGRGYRK